MTGLDSGIRNVRRLAALVVVLAAACEGRPPGGKAREPAAVERPPPPRSDLDVGAWLDAGPITASTPAPRPPVVTLLHAGAAPRALLAYAPTPGVRVQQSLQLDIRQTFVFSGAAAPLGAKSPSITLTLTTIAPAAGEPWRYEIGRVRTDGSDLGAEMVRKLFGSWQPTQDELRIDARGVRAPDARAVFAGRSTAVNETFRVIDDLFDALVPVLPAEPVGDGARWRVDDEGVRGGVSVRRATTYTLSRTSAGARLHVEAALEGMPQRMMLVSPTGALLAEEMLEWHVEVEADYVFDPTTLLPRLAQATSVVKRVIPDHATGQTASDGDERAGQGVTSSTLEIKAQLGPAR